jgi:hypothetical protein
VLFPITRRNQKENLITLGQLYVFGVVFGLLGSTLF